MTDEYRRYLKSKHWQEIRQRALDYHGRSCAICGTSRRLQVHHLSYQRLGHELMSDFRILCKQHHPKGNYSAFEIDRDRHSMIFVRALEWLLFLPFRLAWALLRLAWRSLHVDAKKLK